MNDALVKRGFMVYPFASCLRHFVGRCVVAFFVATLLTFTFQGIVQAQSDEEVALEFRNRGFTYQQQGDFNKALFYYTRAAAMDPSSAVIQNDMGLMQEYLGHKNEAEGYYRRALELDRNYLPAYANLGLFYSKQGQYSLAVTYLKDRVSRGSPDDTWTLQAQEELENIYQLMPELKADRVKEEAASFSDQISEAKKKLQRNTEKSRELGFEMAYHNGVNLAAEKRYAEAIESLEAAVGLNPRSADAQHALKRARYDKEKAERDEEAEWMQVQTKGLAVDTSLDQMSGQPSAGKKSVK